MFEKHNGVWGGCWCVFYHGQGAFPLGGRILANRNRKRKQTLVAEGRAHGIIVYSNGTPVGWCQFGQREELPRLDASQTYLRIGVRSMKEKGLWRITCFFSDRDYRGVGVASFALKAALSAIRKREGGIVEAYPLQSPGMLPRKTEKGKASLMWSGTVNMFRNAGFKIIAPLGKSRQLVPRTIY